MERLALINKRNPFPIILGFIGFCLIIFSTSCYGIGVSPNSVGYISVARNLLKGIGFIQWDGRPLIYEPPLYPVVLTVIDYLFRVDPLVFINIVNALIFGTVIYLTGRLFSDYLTSSISLSALGSISVLFSIPLIYVFLWAWTEPLFICFTLFYFLFIGNYSSRKDFTSLSLSSIFAALACLTRNAGIILILTGGICIVFFRQDDIKSKVRHFFIFTFISALPITIWIIRNLLISSTFYGPITASSYTYSQELTATFYTLLSWFLPPGNIAYPILVVFGITIIFVVLLGVRILWIKEKTSLVRISPILLFLFVYLIFLMGFSKTAFSGLIDNRYLSPVFIPGILLLFSTIGIIFRTLFARASPKLGTIFPVVVIILWLIYPAKTTIVTLLSAKDQGQGYTSKVWRESETIQYLTKNQTSLLGSTIYSNGNDFIYILTEVKGKLSPRQEF